MAAAAPSSETLTRLSLPLHAALSSAYYAPPPDSALSVQSLLLSLLDPPRTLANLVLCCAAVAAAAEPGRCDAPALHWIPPSAVAAARILLAELAAAVGHGAEAKLLAVMAQEVVPMLKKAIKESCVDADSDDVVASSTPVVQSVVASHQFRWIVSQIGYPKLGELCWLVVPCALTALDHFSPEVKEQGMISFIHIAENATSTELSCYEEAILDACCHNIPCTDDLWPTILKASILLLTCTQQSNPRSPWFDQMLEEMLGHLERQPLNRERRIAWLTLIEPVFDAMGLFVLAHFRRLFALFFQWMHVDDDETVLLVLDRVHAVVKLTWIRKSPHINRLVNELVLLYKEVAMRKSRELLRSRILRLLVSLQRYKGSQFDEVWHKHEGDPDLATLVSSFRQLAAK